MGFLLRSCCLCFSPTVASFAIGSVGILLSCIFLVPLSIFLENHTFYITEFARSQRDTGNYLDDDQVPAIIAFSKVLYTVLLCMDVTYIFSCILLLVGVATKRYQLMLPWLVYMFLAILVVLTLVISFIIGLPDYASLAVFLASSPVLLITAYLWLVVASTYQMIKAASKPDLRLTASASQSSLDSLKGGIQRVLGGTPPPPYQAVRTEPSSPGGGKCRRKYARQISNESNTSDTVFFDVSSTRRSSELTPSTKPASPVPFQQQQLQAGGASPPLSSGGGIIKQLNTGSQDGSGSQQDVGSYQQHCITMISPAAEGPTSDPEHSLVGHTTTTTQHHQHGHSNVSLDDQQLQVSGTRLAHGPLSVGPGGPATGPVRPIVGRTRGGSVTTSDRERHFIPGGQLKSSATLPHLQPLHKGLETENQGIGMKKSSTSYGGINNPTTGKGCRRSTQSVSSNRSRESVTMQKRRRSPPSSAANIVEAASSRETKNNSAAAAVIKDRKDSKSGGQTSALTSSTATTTDNQTTWSSISDATSSISTTSLDSTNILV